MSRRDVLKVAGASVAVIADGGLAARPADPAWTVRERDDSGAGATGPWASTSTGGCSAPI